MNNLRGYLRGAFSFNDANLRIIVVGYCEKWVRYIGQNQGAVIFDETYQDSKKENAL